MVMNFLLYCHFPVQTIQKKDLFHKTLIILQENHCGDKKLIPVPIFSNSCLTVLITPVVQCLLASELVF